VSESTALTTRSEAGSTPAKRPRVTRSAALILKDNPNRDLAEAAIAGQTTYVLHHNIPFGDALSCITAGKGHGKEWRDVLLATADSYLTEIFDGMTPAGRALDPLEEMLIAQCVLLHARFIEISRTAAVQPNPKWFATMNEACDRVANQFRRAMQTLSDYRNPRTTMFVKGQANVAGQQVVQNTQNNNPNSISENQESRNELETVHEAKALPALGGRKGIAGGSSPGNGSALPPVGVEHRPANGRGKGEIRAEQQKARGVQSRNGSKQKGRSGVDRKHGGSTPRA
jgi:hypothetical protein